MVDFNGFDKGVIGKKLPADTTLTCMRKSELIDLLHLAENNHRVLADAYKIVVDTSKCNICPLHLDARKVEDIKVEERRKFAEWLSNHQNIYIIDGYMWKKCVEVVDCKVTLEDVLAEYEKEQKGETK